MLFVSSPNTSANVPKYFIGIKQIFPLLSSIIFLVKTPIRNIDFKEAIQTG